MAQRHLLNGNLYTIKELAGISGIKEATIRDRLRRGYPIEQAIKITATNESVEQFCEASWWEDWIGMPITYLYEIYWKWCIENRYTALQKQGFSRQIMSVYPMLKTVPTKRGDKCHRVIRLRG